MSPTRGGDSGNRERRQLRRRKAGEEARGSGGERGREGLRRYGRFKASLGNSSHGGRSSSPNHQMYSQNGFWKGKERRAPSIEGPGGREGVVLPLEMVGSGLYDVSYSVPVTTGHGSSARTFSLQVDSGSSDLWIAAKGCSTSSCSDAGGRLYSPAEGSASAVDTGYSFAINYLHGYVEGPIWWDRVEVGGYGIETQAIAAASRVDDEPLSPQFVGILGLALPLNSVIAERIPPVVGNDPDGAAWGSNLFSITPSERAPANRFLSMTLSRPGSDRVPSLLGIGRHPTGLLDGQGHEVGFGDHLRKIEFGTLVGERAGTLFWKTNIRAISVWTTNSTSVAAATGNLPSGESPADWRDLEGMVEHPIQLPRSGSGGVFPSAILDSGVPLIFTTSAIANSIYGALGISPAADGQYYVPCSSPLLLSIRIDSRRSIPIHPLDVTADPPGESGGRSKWCTGLIQSADGVLGGINGPTDVILGVPFLRNVYNVMGYTVPNEDGTFPIVETIVPVAVDEQEEPLEEDEDVSGSGLEERDVVLARKRRRRALAAAKKRKIGKRQEPPTSTSTSTETDADSGDPTPPSTLSSPSESMTSRPTGSTNATMTGTSTVMSGISSSSSTSSRPRPTPTPGTLIAPRLGLLALTDPRIALWEFHTVRIQNQALPPASEHPNGSRPPKFTSTSSTNGNGNNSDNGGAGAGDGGGGGGRRVRPGIAVLIALLGFFALCAAFFLVRWVLQKRREARREAEEEATAEAEAEAEEERGVLGRSDGGGGGGGGGAVESGGRGMREKDGYAPLVSGASAAAAAAAASAAAAGLARPKTNSMSTSKSVGYELAAGGAIVLLDDGADDDGLRGGAGGGAAGRGGGRSMRSGSGGSGSRNGSSNSSMVRSRSASGFSSTSAGIPPVPPIPSPNSAATLASPSPSSSSPPLYLTSHLPRSHSKSQSIPLAAPPATHAHHQHQQHHQHHIPDPPPPSPPHPQSHLYPASANNPFADLRSDHQEQHHHLLGLSPPDRDHRGSLSGGGMVDAAPSSVGSDAPLVLTTTPHAWPKTKERTAEWGGREGGSGGGGGKQWKGKGRDNGAEAAPSSSSSSSSLPMSSSQQHRQAFSYSGSAAPSAGAASAGVVSRARSTTVPLRAGTGGEELELELEHKAAALEGGAHGRTRSRSRSRPRDRPPIPPPAPIEF